MRRLHATKPGAGSLEGFTLVELMVSITILTIIVVILTNVFNATTKAWITTEGGNERRRSARFLTDFIGTELRGAMLPVESKSADVTKPNLQMLINPPTSMVPADYQNPHSIFWQAPLATERTLGDVAEVGYFVKWETTGNQQIPSLRRLFVNPTVYDSVNKTVTSNPNFLIYTQATSWLSESILKAVAPGDKAHGYTGLFADNVVGLWVRFYGLGDNNKEGITIKAGSSVKATKFDSRIGYDFQVPNAPGVPAGTVKNETRYLPLQVSVSIAQIDTQRLPRLQNVVSKVQKLTAQSDVLDASDFMEKFRKEAETDGQMRALMQGMRVYSTDVLLDNGR